jgi:hypothetical protein
MAADRGFHVMFSSPCRVAHLSYALISAASFSKSRTSLFVPSRAQRRPPWRDNSGGQPGPARTGTSRCRSWDWRTGSDGHQSPARRVIGTNEHRQAAIFPESEPNAGRLAAPSTCCCPLRYHASASLIATRPCPAIQAMTAGVPISRTLFQFPLKGRPGVGTCWPCIIEALNGALSARGSDIVLTALLNP